MTTNANSRRAHALLDEIANGRGLGRDDVEHLRSFLPAPPMQKTLEELRREVYNVWTGTNGNEWPDDIHGDLETWLDELQDQLTGLKDTPAPGLPDGMRLATHPAHGLCVVSPTTDEDGERRVFYLSTSTDAGADSRWVPVSHLTFLDKETAYPGFLQGEAEYDRAPDGTIVVYKKSIPFIKWGGNWQAIMADDKPTAAQMGTTRRRVLRWGYGND